MKKKLYSFILIYLIVIVNIFAQQPSTWSYYPARKNVDMNGFDFINWSGAGGGSGTNTSGSNAWVWVQLNSNTVEYVKAHSNEWDTAYYWVFNNSNGVSYLFTRTNFWNDAYDWVSNNSNGVAYAKQSGTSTYANVAGTSTYANTAGTSIYANTSDTSTYANTAGTANTSTYANTAGTSTYANTAGYAPYTNQFAGTNTTGVVTSVAGEESKYLKGDGTWGTITSTKTHTFGTTIDGGANPLTIGSKGFVPIPYNGTIKSWTMLECSAPPITGSCVMDIWKTVYSNYPPTISNSIIATNGIKPMILSGIQNRSTITNWTSNVVAGDVFGFYVSSNSTCRRILISLEVEQ